MFLAAAQSNTTVIIHHLSAINKDNNERGKKKSENRAVTSPWETKAVSLFSWDCFCHCQIRVHPLGDPYHPQT